VGQNEVLISYRPYVPSKIKKGAGPQTCTTVTWDQKMFMGLCQQLLFDY